MEINCMYYEKGRCRHPKISKWWYLRFPKCVLKIHRNNFCDYKVRKHI